MTTLLQLINRLLGCIFLAITLLARGRYDDTADELKRGYDIGTKKLEDWYKSENK